MKNLGKIVVIIAVMLSVVYGIYFAGSKGWLDKTPLKNLDYSRLNFVNQETMDQTKILTERAQETGEHMQNVLGDQVKVDEEAKDKTLPEKAIEYGQYLYCKQVVTDWEKE